MSIFIQLVSASGNTLASQEIPDGPCRITLPAEDVARLLDAQGGSDLAFAVVEDLAPSYPHKLPPDWSVLDG